MLNTRDRMASCNLWRFRYGSEQNIIMDRLSKVFTLYRFGMSSAEKLADIFVREILARHGVPVSIMSDQNTRFTS